MPPESSTPSGSEPRAREGHRDGINRAEAPILGDRRQVAELLGISIAHVSKLLSSGRIPGPRRLGRAVRWDLDELRHWSASGCPSRSRWDVIRKGGRS